MDLLHDISFGFSFFWYFCDIFFFNFLNYFLWLRITDEGSVPEMRMMVHIINVIRFKIVYTSWSLFIFQPLHSLGEYFTHLVSVTAGGPESPWGHMQPSSTVDFSWFVAFREHQHFYRNCNFWGLLTIPFSLGLFWHFCDISFKLFSYFVWLRITDYGSVLEMRIWSILLSLFSYCKIQAFTLNTLWGFSKIYAYSTFFVLGSYTCHVHMPVHRNDRLSVSKTYELAVTSEQHFIFTPWEVNTINNLVASTMTFTLNYWKSFLTMLFQVSLIFFYLKLCILLCLYRDLKMIMSMAILLCWIVQRLRW